jgi:hypothetical protein
VLVGKGALLMGADAATLGARAHRPTTIHRENGGATDRCWCEDCHYVRGRSEHRRQEARDWRREYEREAAQGAEEFADEMRHLFGDE